MFTVNEERKAGLCDPENLRKPPVILQSLPLLALPALAFLTAEPLTGLE